MPSKLISAPTGLAITLADAKLALRIDITELDTLVTAWIKGVTAHAEHYMGRSILSQTWQQSLDAFPDEIRLQMPPVTSVSFVKYLDATGLEQTLATNQYVVDTVTEPCRITPAYQVSWPQTYAQAKAVKVEYVTGYGATDTSTPAEIKLYLLAKLVEQFDPHVRPDKDTVQSTFIDRLLDRYRILEVG